MSVLLIAVCGNLRDRITSLNLAEVEAQIGFTLAETIAFYEADIAQVYPLTFGDWREFLIQLAEQMVHSEVGAFSSPPKDVIGARPICFLILRIGRPFSNNCNKNSCPSNSSIVLKNGLDEIGQPCRTDGTVGAHGRNAGGQGEYGRVHTGPVDTGRGVRAAQARSRLGFMRWSLSP